VRSLSRTLAWAIAGLILFVPANIYPIIRLKVLGLEKGATLFAGVQSLASEGHLAVAVLTFIVSIAAPLLKLLLLVWILWGVRRPPNQQAPGLAPLFRFYRNLDAWGMLEVYMLGLLIAFSKLGDMAEVITGIGLYSFAGLMLVSVCCSVSLDEQEVWQRMERV
jgi:paraquat-inducible protein A